MKLSDFEELVETRSPFKVVPNQETPPGRLRLYAQVTHVVDLNAAQVKEADEDSILYTLRLEADKAARDMAVSVATRIAMTDKPKKIVTLPLGGVQ